MDLVRRLRSMASRRPPKPPHAQHTPRPPRPSRRHRLLYRWPLLPPPDLILPAQISPRRGRLRNPLHDLWQIHRVVVQPRIRVRQRRIPIPAMLRPRPILHLTLIRNPMPRRTRSLQEIFHQINRVIQKVSIVTPHIQMDLPLQLRPQRRPVPLQLRIEIVVLPPISATL
jgi:hypothetical protein